jgi:3-methylfumaryl-CoA hydratase
MAQNWDKWIGAQRQQETVLQPWPVHALDSVLDQPAVRDVERLPPLWHWLYFLETAPQHRIGMDGHPEKGDFLPPVPNPRRMFAGSRSQYFKPLIVSLPTQLTETVQSVSEKSGGLFLVTVNYQYCQENELCVEEQRDFIYLPEATTGSSANILEQRDEPLEEYPWSLDVSADPTRLMRFSALTFNSHRIHYDVDYARDVEGYPGLVVHGPLTAMLLLELSTSQAQQAVRQFKFRAKAPLFCGQNIRLRGVPSETGAQLYAYRPDGQVAMEASVTYKQD